MKHRMLHIFLLILVGFCLTGCQDNESAEQKLDKYMAKITDDKNGPSISLMIIDNGNIAYQKSFGLANVETKEHASSSTNYRIASLTKMFTAACIVKLKEENKINYTDKVSKYLPDFPEYGKDITILQLLEHTSGLMDYYGEPVKLLNKQIDREHQLTDDDVYEIVKKLDDTYFEPGTEFLYSDTGYTVLGRVVAAVSGMSLSEYMTKEIFKPLHMDHTIAYDPLAKQEIPNRAFGSGRRGSKYIVNDQSYSSAVLADGGVYSSLEDLYKWDNAITNGSLFKDKIIQEAISSAESLKPDGSYQYHFGWFFLKNENGFIEQCHEGNTQGFSTTYLRLPKLKKTLIVLSNKNDDEDAYLLHRIVKPLYLQGQTQGQ